MHRRSFIKACLGGIAGFVLAPFIPKVKAEITSGLGPLPDYLTDEDAWFLKPYSNTKSSDLTAESLQKCFDDIKSRSKQPIFYRPKEFVWIDNRSMYGSLK